MEWVIRARNCSDASSLISSALSCFPMTSFSSLDDDNHLDLVQHNRKRTLSSVRFPSQQKQLVAALEATLLTKGTICRFSIQNY